jgi:hypothetical protein
MVNKFEKKADRILLIEASVAKVQKWLTGMSEESWLSMVEGNWTAKDLVGHLAAWSDLLLDQIEALAQNTNAIIQLIDIDHWNAAQITLRSDWSITKVRKEWEQSTVRARSVVMRLQRACFAG